MIKNPTVANVLFSITLSAFTLLIAWYVGSLYISDKIELALKNTDSEVITSLKLNQEKIETLLIETYELQKENKKLQDNIYQLALDLKSNSNLNKFDSGIIVLDKNHIPSLSKPVGCQANRGLVKEKVNFSTKFTSPPTIITSFVFLDFAKGVDHRLKAKVTNVTTTKFELTFNTWCDTKISHTELKWLAVGS